jgi:hypothetical protein
VLEVLGHEPFRDDVLPSGGLDDRRTPNKYMKRAEDLMADAVGADTAFFSTCGSSLSVKAAMMAVAPDLLGSSFHAASYLTAAMLRRRRRVRAKPRGTRPRQSNAIFATTVRRRLNVAWFANKRRASSKTDCGC